MVCPRILSPDFTDWVILDIEVTMRQLKAVTDRGLVPALVYALTVIQDSKGRFLPGDWVKTTLAVSFSHGCLFETKNTIYVLMGSGRRVRTGLEVVFSIFKLLISNHLICVRRLSLYEQ